MLRYCQAPQPGLRPARLAGKVLNLSLEFLITETMKHPLGAADGLTRLVSIANITIEPRHLKRTAKPERIAYVSPLERALPER